MLVKLLAEKSGNLCVVGDDDQSIYQFRGATIENILNFESTFPHTKVIRLEQNYRSTKTILDAANAVIAHNTVPKREDALDTESAGGKDSGPHGPQRTRREQAEYIVQSVLDTKESNGRNFRDYAILYRMNTQSSALERHFAKAGIPYRIIGGLRFYERREIRDLIAYLSVLNNPNDEMRLRRIINQPKRSIGDKTIAVASEIANQIGESLFYVISHADEFEPLKRTAQKLFAICEDYPGFDPR